jgi:hypothetical protein
MTKEEKRGRGRPKKTKRDLADQKTEEEHEEKPAPLAFGALGTNTSSTGPGQQGEQDPPQPATGRRDERGTCWAELSGFKVLGASIRS